MDHEKTEDCSGPRFEPALWRQRKLFACQAFINSGVTSVIDFGCGEGALTSTLIHYYDENNPVTRVAAVDISRECLDQAIQTCEPQAMDLGEHARPYELSIHFFQGSVDVADERLLGYEGLACMEVIEHLDPPVLAGFWKVVLGTYHPKVVVLSTPNAEFNVHFPNLRYGTPESTFRHWDHRFEWTRQEFQQWCKEAANQYGYSVEFSGVGTIDGEEPAEGYCSQIAILKKGLDVASDIPATSKNIIPPQPSIDGLILSKPYKHVTTIEYPYYNKEHSEEELLEFLHNRIALIRPLPSPPSDGSGGDGFHRDVSKSVDHQEGESLEKVQSEQEQQEQPQKQAQQDSKEGQLHLSRLWSEYQVQQRVKTRKRLIELLKLSSLVRLSEDQSLILYDEADPFWEEFEKRYNERTRDYGTESEEGYTDDGYSWEERDGDSDYWAAQDQGEYWPSYEYQSGDDKDDSPWVHDGSTSDALAVDSVAESSSTNNNNSSADGWGSFEPDAWRETHPW
ncbi:Small RNA 2'-O-methyltransferase [Actinomortierella wolfii]|nr:Small RNA 2'-O-methyltransferase [Actinomortierella wolfii]